MPVIYLIGSLRSPRVPETAAKLREAGYEVFDDWYAAGPEADDYWQQYEVNRGHNFIQALDGFAAYHVWEYDRYHLNRADIGVLVMPAGKSGHLELGYMIGSGKPCYILLEKEPERYDVMYRFAKGVYFDYPALLADLPRL
jgi:nucleoside 2-deoxyribosyltransferase